jgi:hypothetical protein
MGFAEDVARERAMQMHSFLLGHVQIARRGVRFDDPVEYARGAYRLLIAP